MPHMNLRLALPIVFAFAFPHLVMQAQAQVVPGTGQQIVEVFDDFEDPNWSFTLNLPKSSANIDKVERHPSGFAANRLFLESMYRGTPDFVRRVETPAGGLPGSTGALAMQTMNSGIPGEVSHKFQQDDLIAGVQQKLGYVMPVSWTPSYVCRVYVPPFDKWERRHGSHFGFRADCMTTISTTKSVGRFFKNFGSLKKQEQYWPGFFIQLNTKQMTGQKEDSAILLMRGDELGHDIPGPKITHAGWWTLGMTFTPDGKVHYYAHEGVANLTARDHLYSNFPYGYKCEQTSTYFFNIVNQDDGRTWSTRWIVDDPKVYVATGNYRPPVPQQVAQKPAATTAQTQPAPAQLQMVPVGKMPATPVVPAVTAPPNAAAAVVANPTVLPPAVLPAPAATPAIPVPQLATRPIEISTSAPKADSSAEVPESTSASVVAPLDSNSVEPLSLNTVAEEPTAPASEAPAASPE